MAVTQSAAFSSSLSFSETTTLGDQTQVEKYFLSDGISIPTGTDGTPTNWFNGYAKSTGIITSGATLTVDFTAIPHQAIAGGDVNRNFTHINNFYFEPTSSTGVDDNFVIKATGTDAFTNLFYGGSGGVSGYPVKAYSSFTHTDYYGTSVTSTNRLITIYNSGAPDTTGLDYKYMVVGATG